MGRQRRRARRRAWGVWARPGSEVAALGATALVGVIAALGWLADAVVGASPWWRLVLFAASVLALGMGAVTLLRGWLAARRWLARRAAALPAGAALAVAGLALWLASGPAFHARLTSLRMLVGGRAETERLTLAHQVYAAYRRADLAALARVLERAKVYEPTVLEAAAGFGVDAEVLMGVGAAESAFYPRDGARDFATIQPYLNTLPRDYPIRVLSAALAYRLWRTEGRLPRYEDGNNAQHIQSVGVPGLVAARG